MTSRTSAAVGATSAIRRAVSRSDPRPHQFGAGAGLAEAAPGQQQPHPPVARPAAAGSSRAQKRPVMIQSVRLPPAQRPDQPPSSARPAARRASAAFKHFTGSSAWSRRRSVFLAARRQREHAEMPGDRVERRLLVVELDASMAARRCRRRRFPRSPRRRRRSARLGALSSRPRRRPIRRCDADRQRRCGRIPASTRSA